MNVFREMALEAGLMLVLLVTGFTALLSLLLILSPDTIRKLSDRFNSYMDFDAKLAFLDRDVPTSPYIFRHHRIVGSFFIVGATALLICLFFLVNIETFRAVWQIHSTFTAFKEIIASGLIILGKLAGFAGLVLGFCLFFNAEQLQQLEQRIASPIRTQPLVDRLNAFHHGLDDILLRHPVIFGICGLLASILLGMLAMSGLL